MAGGLVCTASVCLAAREKSPIGPAYLSPPEILGHLTLSPAVELQYVPRLPYPYPLGAGLTVRTRVFMKQLVCLVCLVHPVCLKIPPTYRVALSIPDSMNAIIAGNYFFKL